MTDLTPNHPAVEAALLVVYGHRDETCAPEMADAITAALPHLTADDLRNTDVAEEIRTEGWMQGWAAGRDLDGDEDATPYLRDTPAGKQLMAEAWQEGVDHGEQDYSTARDPDHVCPANPYREGDE